MIEIIPAIDIIEGHCVRLQRGDYSSVKQYGSNPVEQALVFRDAGVRRLHMVDLDGARSSEPKNLRTLEAVASATGLDIEWGGGIKSEASLKSSFDAGATRAICGSVAVKNPDLFEDWLRVFSPEKIILGADARNGKVAVHGWLEESEMTLEQLVGRFVPCGLKQVICTDISRDGMLQGPSFELYGYLQEKFADIDFTVSGGMSSMADIERLNEMNLRHVIVGKAYYEGRITIKDIEKWLQNA